jgi:hypothetical protein
MTRPFEPQDVINKYKQLDFKPLFHRFGVRFVENVIEAIEPCCCPLTVMMVGEPRRGTLETVVEEARCRWPGFDPWSFVAGVDGQSELAARLMCEHGHHQHGGEFNKEAYELGKECRDALTVAFPEDYEASEFLHYPGMAVNGKREPAKVEKPAAPLPPQDEDTFQPVSNLDNLMEALDKLPDAVTPNTELTQEQVNALLDADMD